MDEPRHPAPRLWLAGAWAAEAAAAAAHVLAALAAARAFRRGRTDEGFASFALVLAMPALGLVGLSAVRLAARLAPPSGMYQDMHAAVANLPGPEQPPESLDRVFEWIQKQLSVQPLADVIRGGDPKTQRWAIELLERRGDGMAVELLREALQAEDRDTQVAASAALSRVEERLTAWIARARQMVEREARSAATWSSLGDACRAYQASRLLEPVMGRHWLGEAEAAYRRALELAPESRGPILALAQVLLALGRLEDAEALVRDAQALGASAEADLLLAEMLFVCGRWGELRQACREAVSAGRREELVLWWSGAQAE